MRSSLVGKYNFFPPLQKIAIGIKRRRGIRRSDRRMGLPKWKEFCGLPIYAFLNPSLPPPPIWNVKRRPTAVRNKKANAINCFHF